MAGTEYAGELVIEWPDVGAEFGRHALPASKVALYEFRFGFGLELLADVMALTVQAPSADGLITAEVTRRRLTGDPDKPHADEVSTWLVVGFRAGAKG